MSRNVRPDALFREMTLEDVPEVSEIEKASFHTPWSQDSFVSELLYNQLAWYYVLEYRGSVVAYGGLWTIAGEGHITNIAVRPDMRGHGLGRLITEEMLGAGEGKGCTRFTLEVRPANRAAVQLYESLGFKGVGLRPKYYEDTGEDALIMWRE
jgi:ribosomal-protein-alanine N-acetyltransferase